MRTYPKLQFRVEAPRFRVDAHKFMVGAHKFRVHQSWELDILFLNVLEQGFEDIFGTQVQIDHNAKAIKLRQTCSNIEPAL